MEPVITRSGEFTLAMCTDGAKDAYAAGEYDRYYQSGTAYTVGGKPLDAITIPYIVIPMDASVNGVSMQNLKGYVGVVIDNIKKTLTYAILGEVGPKGVWKEVSVKAAWNLGYTQKQANGKIGPHGNFTIGVFLDSKPAWRLDNLAKQIEDEGSKRMGAQASNYSVVATGMALSGTTAARSVDATKIKEYIITIGSGTESVDYTAMRSLGVIGVMVEAGQLYDVSHVKQSRYDSPRLESQIKAAVSAQMPYALYTTVRSRNTVEAKEELNHLTACVRKYPPALGVWLVLNMTDNVSTNNSIVNTYYEHLSKIGLQDKVGFYVTRDQLNRITWSQYQDKWLLWLNEHVSDISTVSDLLTPEFFDL